MAARDTAEMTAGRVEIGMWGWRDEPWTAGFYPEDLPEDWRLAYYANEFRRVLVPAAYLVQADAQALETWCTEVTPPFRFVLELPQGWGWSQAQDRWARLLASKAAVVDAEGQGAVAGHSALTLRQAVWTPPGGQRPGGEVVGLIRSDGPIAAAALKGWIAELAARGAPGEPLVLVFAGGPQALEAARQARMIVELMGL